MLTNQFRDTNFSGDSDTVQVLQGDFIEDVRPIQTEISESYH